MSTWLSSLPHQIPFRAASAAKRIDEKTIEGLFLCSADDALTSGPTLDILLVEAMAQIAGGLAFEASHEPAFLSAIDQTVIQRTVRPGDLVRISAVLEASFQGMFRFQAVASIEGLECARARFYLAQRSS